jgi:hypothetical protein
MANKNSINNKVPATNTQQFLVGNLDQSLSTPALACDSSISANTSGLQTPLTLSAACSGTPTTNFGVSLDLQAHTSNNTMAASGRIASQWDTATDGAQSASLRFYTTTSGADLAEILRANSFGLSTNSGTDFFKFSTGSWTPTIDTSNHDGAGTYSISWTAHTGTGNMLVNGLPFTSDSTANLNWAFSVWASNLTWAANTQLMGYVDNNAITAQLQYSSSGAAASAIPIDTSAQIIISGCYMSAT